MTINIPVKKAAKQQEKRKEKKANKIGNRIYTHISQAFRGTKQRSKKCEYLAKQI